MDALMSGDARQKEPEFITTKQVAALIGRTIQWVHYARKRPGEGPPAYLTGKRYLYRPAEVMAWLQSRRVG